MSHNEGFFQSTFSEKISVISIVMLFSASSIFFTPLAILFKEPEFICTNNETKSDFVCSENLACSYEFPFKIDKENGSHSFATDFGLICEASSYKRLALSCIFFGYSLAAFLQTFFIVDSKKRKLFILLGGFGLSLSLFLMLVVFYLGLDFIWIIALCFISGVAVIYINCYAYVFVSENFRGEIAALAIVLMNVIWGIEGIVFALIGYFTNADWKVIIGFGCLSTLATGILFGISKPKKNEITPSDQEDLEEENEESINLWSYFKDLWPHKIIRTNFLIFTWVWGFYMMTYTVQYVELESIGGSIYFNTILCCCLEVIAALFAGVITKRFSCDKLLKISISIEAIVFMLYFFTPPSLSSLNGIESTFFIFCLMIAKICNDLINLMVYLSLAKMFTDKYIGFFLVISRGFSRLLMILIPYLNYLIKGLEIHPFVFYGIVLFFNRFLLNFTQEVDSDAGLETLLNDVNIGVMNRTAVISASHSFAASLVHDQILKKIKVEGVNLSLIKNSRKNPDSIKVDSDVLKLSTPLLKKINVQNSFNKKMNLFEVKQSLKSFEMK